MAASLLSAMGGLDWTNLLLVKMPFGSKVLTFAAFPNDEKLTGLLT